MTIEALFEAERRPLWGLCYRLTGSASDADEIVQDTFVRLLERPPSDTSRSVAPWLRTVALNLARDRLRKRRETYIGPFLPEPVSTAELEAASTPVDARLSMMQSASWAFLIALERLDPKQRAVLILRDVYDLSTRETAQALKISEGHAKVLLHRARLKLDNIDGAPSPDANERSLQAMTRFFSALAAGDATLMAGLLRDDIVYSTDGAGEVFAARKPIVGIERVLRFLFRTQSETLPLIAIEPANFVPSLVYRQTEVRAGNPSEGIAQFVTDEQGLITAVWVACAPSKLRRFARTSAILQA